MCVPSDAGSVGHACMHSPDLSSDISPGLTFDLTWQGSPDSLHLAATLRQVPTHTHHLHRWRHGRIWLRHSA